MPEYYECDKCGGKSQYLKAEIIARKEGRMILEENELEEDMCETIYAAYSCPNCGRKLTAEETSDVLGRQKPEFAP